ncbi:hypothetical protein Pen02_63900 [Plantactinospora endophytica]|uniref:Uncharacterized protein n=1 Tax=Plantactinospora endophytica TaxID=673535 RepID=A0ABQ4E9S5_9ACTN|nr:hypothetical protein Pen02_63900 [Plantactinospora endophytica]
MVECRRRRERLPGRGDQPVPQLHRGGGGEAEILEGPLGQYVRRAGQAEHGGRLGQHDGEDPLLALAAGQPVEPVRRRPGAGSQGAQDRCCPGAAIEGRDVDVDRQQLRCAGRHGDGEQ